MVMVLRKPVPAFDMTALHVSDRDRDRKSFMLIKLQHAQRPKFIFSNPS